MAFPSPALPPYDVREWQKLPFAERLQKVCGAWAVQGYGTPRPIFIVYAVKVAIYIGVWLFFCSSTPGLGGLANLGACWAEPIAFQKAILWSVMFESLGLGCGSGPLTGRYRPPVGGVLYFVRPGTTKMPLFPGLPVLGGDRRTLLDVALYLAYEVCLVRALLAPSIDPSIVLPVLILLAILGLADKTIFLASRAEHYGSALVCSLFPGDFMAASKVIWAAVWLWAATSKLNAHFPSVVATMQSNSPLTTFGSLRKRLYRSYPDDLRPSPLTHAMAHAGTVIEMVFPLVLLASSGGAPTRIALAVMVLFHFFITASVPMGVPIEWNVMMVYGAFVLFGHHASASILGIGSPLLIAYLVVACFLMQLVGNLFPRAVSFLCSMRYYAGNWAYSIWLFKGESSQRLDRGLVKLAPRVQDQLAAFYDETTTVAILSKVVAFRVMHLQGRALQLLLPKAVADIDAYEYLDGEIVAGVVLGWNFGEGHLHDLQLLRAVQRQCGFEEGELVCIFVESQPLGRPKLAWTIADAAKGVRERGEIDVRSLMDLQPWPATSPAAESAVALRA